MTHPSPSTIAKRAFLASMKTRAPAEAMWIAAADAVVEECAKVADIYADGAKVLGAGNSMEIDIAVSHVIGCAEAIRALKGGVK